MANIADKVAQIRQAIFGKDVRESIASGIEAINTEVETTVAAETTRQSNEVIRLSAEGGRVSAESTRQTQELARQSSIADIEDRFETLTVEQQQEAEVIDARRGKASLGAKVDAMDAETAAHLAENEKHLLDSQQSLSVMRFLNELRIVVTGDSISYNRYSYDSTARADAEAGKYGYKSWAYLLRDSLIHNLPGWQYALDFLVGYETTAVLDTNEGYLTSYFVPLDGKGLNFTFSALNQKAVFFVPPRVQGTSGGFTTNDLFLYFMTDDEKGGTFDVSVYNAITGVQIGTTVEIDNSGDGTYLDRYMKSLDLTTVAGLTLFKIVVEAKTFVGTDNRLMLLGTAITNLFWKHTGVGGTSSAHLATNVQTLVIDHTPDVVLALTGASDLDQGITDLQTYNYMSTFVEAIQTANPYAKIILISMPPYNNHDISLAEAKAEKFKKVATAYGCGFIDATGLFKGINPTLYQFDYTHLNKYGNQVLFETLIKAYFPTLDIKMQNQFNHFASGMYNTEQRDRKYIKWRSHINQLFYATYNVANANFDISTTFAGWFVPQTALQFLPMVPAMLAVSLASGNAVLTITQPFKLKSLAPRYEPVLTNIAVTTDLYLLRPRTVSSTNNTFIYYILKKDGAGVVSHVTDLGNLDANLKLQFNLIM